MIGKIHFPRPAALAGLFVPIAILAACGGKGVTIGSNSGELRTVDPTTVAGTVPACQPQQAHPNVCCKGGPNEASDCVAFVNSPFHKCDADRNTYPDPGTCCDLADPTKCAAPPPNPPPTGCGYACAPGWWPVVNSPGECCHLLKGGDTLECQQSAWGYPVPEPVACAVGGGTGYADAGVPTDASPPPPPQDAGPGPGPVTDASVPPVDAAPPPDPGPGPGPGPIDCDAGAPPPVPAPPPWPGPVCNTPCPNGFHPLPADPSICCATEPNGGEICFSQAGGQAGGPGGVVFGSGGTSAGGGTSGSGGASTGGTPPTGGK